METTAPQQHHDRLLQQHLRDFLPGVDPAVVDDLRRRMTWVELAGGEALLKQGDPGDAMYVIVSGRLRVYIEDGAAPARAVREMGRGQIVGEISMFTDEPRSATVIAIRESVLARLDKADFSALLASSAQASIALTRVVIHRLQTESLRSRHEAPVTTSLVPISDGVDALDVAARLAAAFGPTRRVCVVDAAAAARACALGAQWGDEPGARRRLAIHLDEIEAAHDVVLLVADPSPTPWTALCCRHADELLLLADATQPPALHPTETGCLLRRPPRTEAAEVLVLLHPADTRTPRGTRAWLQRRPVADHVHVRPALARDMARLSRLQSRTAVGLVLAGGGARGLAHLGVVRALQEQGVEFDCVGGTSIGAIMAVCAASDLPLPEVVASAREAFLDKPTSDFNWLPLLSLIKGRRLRRLLDRAIARMFGAGADLEDLWKNVFVVASNFSRAAEEVLAHGPVERALLASSAIPGALPPVLHDGDLLCDGGTFNNFPVDVMRARRGIGRVIGVDLNPGRARHIDLDELPGSWALLRDRWRGRARRRYRLPSLTSYLMNVTILYSTSRQRRARELTDLYLCPPLERVGMLEWHRFDAIERLGYEYAREALAQGSAPPLDRGVTLGRGEAALSARP
ncbi:MAG: patatin-like phospholipase family protein [Burkholderiaceae bacterium]|nr:patatin-like phospholipase family protein [Burkholderiaceae bacterium]